jgi:transcriptional regulator with XRE-family HTH domain
MERSVGDNIRSFRRAKGLRQIDLGKLCGMADSQIGTYERGETKPRLETLERIAGALGITVDDLCRGTMEVHG